MDPKDTTADTTATTTDPVVETNGEENDYKALFEAEKKRTADAEDRRLKAEKVIERLKKEKGQDGDEPADVSSIVRSEIQKIRGEEILSETENAIKSFASSEEEARLIQFHLEKTIVRSGFSKTDIERDIQRAKLLANEGRLAKEREELQKSLSSKESRGGYSVGQSITQPGKMSKLDEEAVAKIVSMTGQSLDVVKKQYLQNKKDMAETYSI